MLSISVIIPCYNSQEYLEECLDSVVNQTFEDFEVICINDGSTDNTLNILEKYAETDNRIRVISQDNSGLAASRNVGLDNAKGKYICFLDSDDYFELNAFQEVFAIAEEKSLDFVIFKLLNFNDETRKTKPWDYFEMDFLKERVGDNVFSYDDVADLLFKMNVTAPGKLFRHEFIKDFRFPEGLMWEDNPFFLHAMLNAKRVYFYDKRLYLRRIRESSMVHSYTDKFSDGIAIFNMMENIIKDYGLYDLFKLELFKRRLYSIFKRFSMCNPEDKQDFFDKIKEDFSNHLKEVESEDYLSQCWSRYRVMFYAALDSETPEEFEYTVRIFDLKHENSQLKRKIKEYKKFNEGVLNSNSWKVTKPLRNISNIYK